MGISEITSHILSYGNSLIILFGSHFSYRMNPSAELPNWYTPVDLEQDKRRWNAG